MTGTLRISERKFAIIEYNHHPPRKKVSGECGMWRQENPTNPATAEQFLVFQFSTTAKASSIGFVYRFTLYCVSHINVAIVL